jgi:hypothetical protein
MKLWGRETFADIYFSVPQKCKCSIQRKYHNPSHAGGRILLLKIYKKIILLSLNIFRYFPKAEIQFKLKECPSLLWGMP